MHLNQLLDIQRRPAGETSSTEAVAAGVSNHKTWRIKPLASAVSSCPIAVLASEELQTDCGKQPAFFACSICTSSDGPM